MNQPQNLMAHGGQSTCGCGCADTGVPELDVVRSELETVRVAPPRAAIARR